MKTGEKIAKARNVSMQSSNGYVIDWSKLCPILGEYQSTVDCDRSIS